MLSFFFQISEESNHPFTKSHSEVTAGFKNPSARNADVPLRSRQHKIPVHTTPITDSFSSDDQRIGSMDGNVLPTSKNGLNTMKLTTDVTNDKIKNASSKRKLAMRRSARMRKLKVLASLLGAKMSSLASSLGKGKGEDAFDFHNTPPLSGGTGEPYKMKINAPRLRLTILPTEETVIPTVDTADGESDWILTEDDTTKKDEEKSSHSNDHKDDSLPHGGPKVAGHEGSTRHGGTTAIPQHKMAVHPGMKTSSGLRWNVAYEHAKLDESKKGKRFKKKKKEYDSRTEDPENSDSTATIVAGILAGILMCLIIYTGVPRLWRICKKRWRRRHDRVFGLTIPSTDYLSEELSEEEVIFDRTAIERNKKSSKGASPKSTPNTSPRRQKSARESYQSTDHATQEQKIWTLTDTLKSTPLMAVPTILDTPRTEVWTVNEVSESKSLDSSFTTSSLSDLSTWTPTKTTRSASLTSVSVISLTSEADICVSDLTSSTRSSTPPSGLTEKTVLSHVPLTTQSRLGPSTSSELTVPDHESLHPSTPKESSSLSLLPTASGELTRTLSMATDSSSTESCKTPVAPRNEVVITMDDDDEEIIYTSGKSQREKLNTVKDGDKERSREEVVISMNCDDSEDESECEASTGKTIYTSEKLGMSNVTTDDAIIDIMSRDDENGEPLAVNDKYNDDQSPLTLPTIPPPTASTELRQGKSLIGGRKALENRRFIKHLISEQESTGFKHDLNTAISRILGEKKCVADKNKGKRIVIKHQTQDTKYSLTESILRAKSMILNENVDKERDKRSFLCRQVIQQTLSYPVRPALRPQRTLAHEIAFAKEIILPGHAHPRQAAARTKVKRKVRCEDKSVNRGASTNNTETKTKYMNHKDYEKWKLLREDAIKKKKAKGIKPGVTLPSLQQVVGFFNISIPDDVNSDVTVCQCYYCDRHRKKERGKKLLKLSRKLLPFKSKPSADESRPDSTGSLSPSSAAAGPSTVSAANGSSRVVPNNRFHC
ncbi:hypothetical protein ACROYT_G041999 [Oculina patagonica]